MIKKKPFKSLISKFAVVYLDFIFFYTFIKQEESKDIKSFMNLMKKNQLFARSLSEYLVQELVFLGHVVSKDVIKPDPLKFKTISESYQRSI